LPEVVIDVDLKKLAPFRGRHFSEHRVRLRIVLGLSHAYLLTTCFPSSTSLELSQPFREYFFA